MLPLRRRRAADLRGFCFRVFVLGLCVAAATAFAAERGINRPRKRKEATATPTPGEQSLTNLPIPVGREMKGLVLPDYDADGHLVGRFEASSAVRLDQERIRFSGLKIVTYSADNSVDLEVDMETSILHLTTKVLSSDQRTTIRRSDFNVSGDKVMFDTAARTSRLIGNVKMVINNSSQLVKKPASEATP